uniref:oral-facial-digital syndrome 1 protein homolog n=1 Tax=Styela clava TaxID=7725 RepID=UPI0019399362|nr:oral-facial-digital syndrome 1 protein homolog [Styela clava]
MSRSKKKEPGMSAEDLKRQMYQSLQSAGVLNNLKGYLRQSVINELRGKHQGSRAENDLDLLAATMKKNAESTWNQKVVDNLILHHLKQSRYLYSLSLFQQESGIDEYDEALTEELLLRLGASPDLLRNHNDKENNQSFPSPNSSSTPVAADNGSKSLMWKLLSRVSSAQNLSTKLNQDSLKEMKQNPKPMSLADKLQAVDTEMDYTLRERRQGDIDYCQSVATLASATRRAEEVADKRARESFEQWKKVELVAMRVSESEKAREQILSKTRELENDYSQRKEALVSREKNAIERLSIQKESLEKDLYQQRQLLLCELEQIRMREKNLQERELMMRDMESVKLKELDLMKSDVLNQQRSNVIGQTTGVKVPTPERTRRDSVVSSCAESLRKSLTGRESRQLDEVLRELDSRSGEAEMLRRELETLKGELTETKSHVRKITEPKPSPRQRNEISPRTSNENDSSLRKRLDDLSRQLNDWKKQDRAEKEANIQNEIGRWKTEVSKLSDARDKLDEKQRQLEQMTSRIQTRINSEPKDSASPRFNEPASKSLRILMDDVTKEPSIRDYDPVHPGHVRWADEMPYSVQPRLTEGGRSPRYSSHNTTGNSNLDFDDSSTTTSSGDLSTSGLRQDIQNKFRTLEKESEDLEQMYKRYIQSNYKHISPDVPGYSQRQLLPRHDLKTSHREKPRSSTAAKSVSRTSNKPANKPQTKSNPTTIPEYQSKPTGTIHTKPLEMEKTSPITLNENTDDINQSQGPIPLINLEKKHDSSESSIASSVSANNNERSFNAEEEKLALSHPEQQQIPFKDKLESFSSQKGKKHSDSNTPSLSEDPKPLSDILKPKPTVRQSTLHPITTPPTKLPPISPQDGESSPLAVSDLLTGESEKEKSKPIVSSQTMLPELKPRSFMMSQPEATVNSQSDSISEELLSSTSSEMSDPLRRSSLEVKSPFERSSLLEKKREELQHVGGIFDSLELPKHDVKSLDHEEPDKHDVQSPKRDLNLGLDFRNVGDIENLLQSIDKSSARSLDCETDRGLAELLNQVEPKASVTSQKDLGFPLMSQSQQKQPVVTSQTMYSADEDSLSRNVGDKIKKADKESKSSSERDPNLLSDKSNDYSDEFLSSTDSKTASEVKTMSDFEPSSTSIPHIDDKVTGMQQSNDEDKSGADANWSTLQLDKSGEFAGFDHAKQQVQSPRISENRQKENQNVVDVFEESQSSDSIDAGSRGEKKSQSSGDDFW